MDRNNTYALGVIAVTSANNKFLKSVSVELFSNQLITVYIHGRNPPTSIAASHDVTSQFAFKCASCYAGSWSSCSIVTGM
jgi:hypothetical protein